MSKDQSQTPRLRLFVALDLPDPVREGIGSWGREALADPALRPVSVENLHITLAFLGHRPAEDVERVERALRECVGPAPLIELRDPEPRPPRGRAHVFGLPALSPGAELIHSQLSEILVSEGLYNPEKRPFWPHVTVARVRTEGRGSRRSMRVDRPPGALPAGLTEAFYGVRVSLYRSELQPSGARYVPLAQVELPGAGRQ